MDLIIEEEFGRNLRMVKSRVLEAAERAGRDARKVRIMAVTKTFPGSAVELAWGQGLRLFGENRVQEAVDKYSRIPDHIDLHLIGHLQRNKARLAVTTFSCVQSIDKLGTALALGKHLDSMSTEKKLDILLEVNTSGEESKFGIHTKEELFTLLEQILSQTRLNIRGLMTVGPLTEDRDKIRRAFTGLADLYRQTGEHYPGLALDILSMGMSGDFEIAVEEGSSMLRLGTALFGRRH
ncbi:MAG: YggS family pyridoxal phosphate-dependent enzyme [Spirochaeta sp.]|nr:YggS family pyridoxal phosphate-dependent enzyme [Spirochaeta sp.]